MIRRILLLAISVMLAVLLLITGFKYGRTIPFSQQWPLFEALRTTASIIFAVVGAWLAIIYPERLKLSFESGNGKTPTKATNLGKLLHPAINSTAILCIVLLVGVCAPLIRQLEIVEAHREVFRGLSYALVVWLTLWQIWTVILTLVPADLIKSAADAEARQKATVEDYKRLGSREDSKNSQE